MAIAPEMTEWVRGLIDRELVEFAVQTEAARRTKSDFCAALKDPQTVDVQFSGGVVQQCWSVTRRNGPYRVVYMPSAGYFSLCVEGQFGPLDIGVHGKAIDCFASV